MEFQCCLPRQTAGGVPRRATPGVLPGTAAATENQRIESKGRVACAQRHCKRMYTRNWGMWARRNLKIILEPGGLACTAVRALLLLALIPGCKEDLGEHLQSGQVLAW